MSPDDRAATQSSSMILGRYFSQSNTYIRQKIRLNHEIQKTLCIQETLY